MSARTENTAATSTTPEVPAATPATATVIKPREFTPKRGFKSCTMTIVDPTIQFKPHHQKTLILEILNGSEEKSMDLKSMVEKVEADEKLWSRLQSKQSVFNCITYHMKDLQKIGVLKVKE